MKMTTPASTFQNAGESSSSPCANRNAGALHEVVPSYAGLLPPTRRRAISENYSVFETEAEGVAFRIYQGDATSQVV